MLYILISDLFDYFFGNSKQASLPGFQVLPLRQFGSWGSEITTKFDPEKDTYVLVSSSDSAYYAEK